MGSSCLEFQRSTIDTGAGGVGDWAKVNFDFLMPDLLGASSCWGALPVNAIRLQSYLVIAPCKKKKMFYQTFCRQNYRTKFTCVLPIRWYPITYIAVWVQSLRCLLIDVTILCVYAKIVCKSVRRKAHVACHLSSVVNNVLYKRALHSKVCECAVQV